jgi:hypothetical protein
MSFVVAAPDALVAAAANVAGIESALADAHAAAAAPTTGVLAAAADEVSTQIAAVFARYGLSFQQLGAQAAAFQRQFAVALSASANSYAAAEAGAVGTLVNPLAGSLGALLTQATGGAAAATAMAPLSRLASLTGAMAVPAASGGIAGAIENLYNFVEPYVAYAFNLASYVVGWAPWLSWLAPQINYFYYLFEPMVQAALFNTLDWLSGWITFSQAVANFWATTTASINQFIYTEINWFLSFLPPLPPLPPLPVI